MYCKNCGKELENGTEVCTACGVTVGNGLKYCADCGTKLENGKCPRCAAPAPRKEVKSECAEKPVEAAAEEPKGINKLFSFLRKK